MMPAPQPILTKRRQLAERHNIGEESMFPDPRRRVPYSRSAGFSLIELLIVIAIILIILAVALPKLSKARMFAQEMAATKAISTIHTAETQYYSQYGQYATSLNQLGPPASGTAGANGAELIDRDLASGEKGGFKFTVQPTPTGYAVAAVPTQFGTSGAHTYFSDQSMSIHQHSGQEPATPVDPLMGETQKEQQQSK
jgi:type IV pilus assembly protein PilA